MPSLRERNRLSAMRETQRAALRLFQERGFDGVSVDEIAEDVGMAASTVYRHFGTKEHLVLWDEHDVALEDALGDRLRRQPPFEAIRDAFIETLGGRYDSDLDFQLERVRFIYATTQLHGAAVEADVRARDELAEALKDFLSDEQQVAASLIAGAALLVLDVAIDQWQQLEAGRSLGELITEAFERLATIDSLV